MKRPTLARISGILGISAAHLVVYVVALSMVFPFVWMVSTSLKPEAEVFGWPPQLLRWPPDWSNYPAAWGIAPSPAFHQLVPASWRRTASAEKHSRPSIPQPNVWQK